MFVFFNDTATTEIYTLSLHDALPIFEVGPDAVHLVDVGDPRDAVLVGLAPDRLGLRLDAGDRVEQRDRAVEHAQRALDRKSTRLNSSHANISYAVFCLKKKT